MLTGSSFAPSTSTSTVLLRCSDGKLTSNVAEVKVPDRFSPASAGQRVSITVDLLARTLEFTVNAKVEESIKLPPGCVVFGCAGFVRDVDSSVKLASFQLSDGVVRDRALGGLVFSRGMVLWCYTALCAFPLAPLLAHRLSRNRRH